MSHRVWRIVSLVALAIYFVFFVVSSAVAEAAVEPEVAVVATTIADAEFLVAAIEAKVRGAEAVMDALHEKY